MSSSQAIRHALKVGKKTQEDLANAMGLSRVATISERLAKNAVDDEMIEATSRITGVSVAVIKNEIERLKVNASDPIQPLSYDELKMRIAELEGRIDILEKENYWLRGLVEGYTGVKPKD